jgi:hypothetical protein
MPEAFPPLVLDTNMVRTSVIEVIADPPVATVAMGMVAEVNPVVFDAGAQLFVVSRYT